MPTNNKFVMSDALSSAFTTLKTYFDQLGARVSTLEQTNKQTFTVHTTVGSGPSIVKGAHFDDECSAILNYYEANNDWPHVTLEVRADVGGHTVIISLDPTYCTTSFTSGSDDYPVHVWMFKFTEVSSTDLQEVRITRNSQGTWDLDYTYPE